jgi:hypothetical protein
MCKGVSVIPVNGVVDKKRILEKNGGPGRLRDTRGLWPKKEAEQSVHQCSQKQFYLKKLEMLHLLERVQ